MTTPCPSPQKALPARSLSKLQKGGKGFLLPQTAKSAPLPSLFPLTGTEPTGKCLPLPCRLPAWLLMRPNSHPPSAPSPD